MRVLVVDHETFLAELVKLALEADGNACSTAASVLAATEMLRSIRFDLIVVDLAADDPKSLVWLEETVLGHPELRGHAFVLTDRLLEHPETLRVQACGARTIQKPFTLHQLRDAVRTMTPVAGKKAGSHIRGPAIET